jgi:hypothetical protein
MSVVVNSRETRTCARETKFVVEESLVPGLVAWARANLARDAFGAGRFGDEYTTTSLYYETPGFDVYHRRGSYGRSKFRVRRYGASDIVFLERKFRTRRLLAKRRTTVPITDLELLAASVPEPGWPGYWFHRRVLLRRLDPLVQMSYDRIARVGVASAGPIRMTVDANLRVLPMPDRAFIPGVGFPLIEGHCIVELKYRVELPALFKRLVEDFGIEPGAVSKYRLGVSVLDYPPVTAPPAPERGFLMRGRRGAWGNVARLPAAG